MGNVPNLRFPEFCGEWETIKVSELLDFYSTNSLSWEQLDYSNGKIKNLHYGLIHKGVPTMVDVACDSLPYIKEESMLKSFTLFKEGDVAFADASEDTNDVAKAIEVVNCDNQQSFLAYTQYMDVIILIGLLLVIKVMLLLLIHSTSRLEELLKVQRFFLSVFAILMKHISESLQKKNKPKLQNC